MDETLGFESKNKSSLKSKFLVRKMSNVVTKIKCFYISRDTLLAQIICSTRGSVEFLNFLLLCSTVVNRMSKSNFFEENK